MKDHVVAVKYDEESIRRQMWKLEMPEIWTPVDLDDPERPAVEKSPGAEAEEVVKRVPDPPAEVPTVKELMDERAGAEDVGSEEAGSSTFGANVGPSLVRTLRLMSPMTA